MAKKTISILIFLLAVMIYAAPLSSNVNNIGEMDWDQFTFWNAAARESILRYRQFPLWNPYSNGGNVMLAFPHSSFLSPFYIPVLIFNPIAGAKFQVLLYLFFGLLGMFYLSRQMKLSGIGGYLAAFLYMFSSIYFLKLSEGHIDWGTMALLPWIFLCFRKAASSVKYICAAIFIFSLTIFGGSLYVPAITAVLLVCYGTLLAMQDKKTIYLKILFIVLVGTFLLCAVKFLPMLEFLSESPRPTVSTETLKLTAIPDILLSRNQNSLYQNTKRTNIERQIIFRGRSYEYGWHEYGAYMGAVSLFLAAIGIIFYWRTHWPLLITGITALLVSLGGGRFGVPWKLLHSLPIYNSLHVPSRFILGVVFCLALFSGMGLSRIEDLSNRIFFKILIAMLVAGLFFDLFLVNASLLKNTATIRLPKIQRRTEFKQRYRDFNLYIGRLRSSMYLSLLENSGVINSYEIIGVKKGAVRIESEAGYRGEAYLMDNQGWARIAYFSPNKIRVDVEISGEDILALNQNYNRGWKARVNGIAKAVFPAEGLAAIRLPSGVHKVEFYYLPLTFAIGAAISLLMLAFLLQAWTRYRLCP